MRLGCLAISAVVAVQLVASPVAAQTLAAKGPWTLIYDTDSCALQRQFGEDENTVALEFRRFFPGDVRAVLSSSNLRPTRSMLMRYRLNDEEEWRMDVTKYNVSTSTGRRVVFFPWALLLPEAHEISDPMELAEFLQRGDLPALETAAAATVGTLTLEDAFEHPISLQVGSLAKPIALMNDCFDDLLTSWNIDAQAHKSLTRSATPVESTSRRLYNFPPISGLIGQMKPTDLTIRLIISAVGEIETCDFDNVGGDPRAAEMSCDRLRRNVRFEPALDNDGTAIRSYYTYRIINPDE